MSLGRWVTLTVYSITLRDEQSQRRFRRGFEVSRRLGAHPHAVTVLEYGITSGCQPFVVTELYENGTVDGQIQGQYPSSVGEVLRMGVALAGALETAHRAGVVHGGIHPARVLLAADRDPALADLGLVPLVDPSGLAALVGPMSYHAPPEVLEGEAPSPATDVYSLASTLYTTLTGRAPYAPRTAFGKTDDDDTTASLLLRILQHDIPAIERRDVPPSLEKLLDQSLSSEARHRPARALALTQALHSCQVELGLAPTQPVVLDIPATLNVVHGGAATVEAPPAPLAPVVPPAAPSPSPAPPASPGPAPERVFIPYPVPDPDPVLQPQPGPLPQPQWEARPEPVAVAPSARLTPVEHQTMAPRFDPLPASRASVLVDDHLEAERAAPELEVRPPPAPATEERTQPTPHTRALPVIVLAVLVAVIFGGVTWSIATGEGVEDQRAQPGDAAGSGTGALAGDRSGMTAVESSVGVQLDWGGSSEESHAVVVFSTAEPPRALPANDGSALLIPTASLNPDAGFCFAVVPAPTPIPPAAELAAQVASDALGPDGCVRSGSADSVQRS